ncbi:hypothetical protein BFJ70_g9742 [Fusarium oxysporum]|nr:hypothetical protein BFJ70_g9742 [Fusarium oxysporum]
MSMDIDTIHAGDESWQAFGSEELMQILFNRGQPQHMEILDNDLTTQLIDECASKPA